MLGAAFLTNGIEGLAGIRPDEFYAESHRVVARAMYDLDEAGTPIDNVTLGAFLKKTGELETVGGYAYLSVLPIATPTAVNRAHYARIVRTDAAARALASASAVLDAELDHGDPHQALAVFDQARERVRGLCAAPPVESVGQMASRLRETFAERCADVAAGRTRIWQMSDPLLGEAVPLSLGKLHVLAMRSGGGKTSVAANGAVFTAAAGHPVAFHSVEMPALDIVPRFISRTSEFSEQRALRGMFNTADWAAYDAFHAQDYPLFVTFPAETIAAVEDSVRRLYRERGVRYHVVDYFQLLHVSDTRASRSEELNEIGQRLKRLTVELPDCGILVLAQLNKRWAGETPVKEDIRHGSGLCDSSDGVTLAWRPGKGTNADDRIKFMLDKARFGGEHECEFAWVEGRVASQRGGLEEELERRAERLHNLAHINPIPP